MAIHEVSYAGGARGQTEHGAPKNWLSNLGAPYRRELIFLLGGVEFSGKQGGSLYLVPVCMLDVTYLRG